ncbi:hypothetical protein RchiOBHm_Chr6g0251251 [Rosa chinensis]|uniref:Uncharacterized protein n=1 Tax=Rosa chinensis TaxID=74649 RepID=A0A2P6PKS0_ROSCH|nr:uncharacterized protein LOC112174125 [Rosa chinensis]PRQ22525.1 hypothetical protein RchiOBHm_Chr6g0251251 [Rosa chinensis]
MESTTSSVSVSTSSKSKCLLFDRRYGWVIDEWKDPSEEALAGGRGMFCVLPLAKAAIKMASQSISLAASSAVKALEKPELFSPQLLQASVNDQLHKITSSLPKPDLNYLLLKGNLSQAASSSSSCEQLESSNSQMT